MVNKSFRSLNTHKEIFSNMVSTYRLDVAIATTEMAFSKGLGIVYSKSVFGLANQPHSIQFGAR